MEFKGTKGKWEYKVIYGKKDQKLQYKFQLEKIIIKS